MAQAALLVQLLQRICHSQHHQLHSAVSPAATLPLC
jgi:hypothetical protein